MLKQVISSFKDRRRRKILKLFDRKQLDRMLGNETRPWLMDRANVEAKIIFRWRDHQDEIGYMVSQMLINLKE